MNLEHIYLCMLSIQYLLIKTPGAGAKQEVCHYSMPNNHLAGHFIAMIHVFIAGRSDVDRTRGDSSSE
ncbi:hypothetical protein M405DRAFT_820773 [Rhizopogon salebrosus TDB-379]|nr:hypothetical protein M405DRAFT_820773 [Rhizopogon salebrosus TDB-379]